MKKDELHSETPQINSGVSLLYRGSKTGESKTLSVILGTLMSYAIALMLSFGSLLTFTSMFSVPFDAVIFSMSERGRAIPVGALGFAIKTVLFIPI